MNIQPHKYHRGDKVEKVQVYYPESFLASKTRPKWPQCLLVILLLGTKSMERQTRQK